MNTLCRALLASSLLLTPLLPVIAGEGSITAGSPPPQVSEVTMFAFDDHSIPWTHNLKVTLVPATKLPENPVLRRGPEGAPDHGHAVLYGSVIKVGGKFRMWYLGMIQGQLEHGQIPGWWRPMCYAESADGVHWTKPELGLVDLNGNKKNNICLIESDPPSLSRVDDYLTVLYEPEDPDPQSRYKAVYIAHLPIEEVRGGRSGIGVNEKRWCSIVCATSADGLRWKVVGDRPANAGGERFEVSGLYHFGGFYYATGQLISPWAWLPDGRDIGRVMLAYRSPDFEHWSETKALSYVRPIQWTQATKPMEGEQMHMGSSVWNRGNVLVGFCGMWHHGPKDKPKGASYFMGVRVDLGLLVSNDGIHFREPVPDFKMIPRGEEGKDWDSIAILQGHAFANVDDKTYVWYSHWDTEGQFREMEVGLATWRRDGFGYLSRKQDDNDAEFVTAPFTLGKSGRLAFNVDGVTADAPLTVELLDGRDQAVAGYSGPDAATITSNGVRQEIVWPKAKEAALPVGQPLVVKVKYPVNSQAKIYTLYVTE
jgi:hypothetical protein